jgi:hypothetical protein
VWISKVVIWLVSQLYLVVAEGGGWMQPAWNSFFEDIKIITPRDNDGGRTADLAPFIASNEIFNQPNSQLDFR